MMTKGVMLDMVDNRIAELVKVYRSTFDGSAVYSSYNCATARRSQVSKDLGTCRLLRCLLDAVPDSFEMDTDEAERAFERLTEPRRLK